MKPLLILMFLFYCNLLRAKPSSFYFDENDFIVCVAALAKIKMDPSKFFGRLKNVDLLRKELIENFMTYLKKNGIESFKGGIASEVPQNHWRDIVRLFTSNVIRCVSRINSLTNNYKIITKNFLIS